MLRIFLRIIKNARLSVKEHANTIKIIVTNCGIDDFRVILSSEPVK